MVGYNLIESNSINLAHVQDNEQHQEPNSHLHLYHHYQFVQQQQHFQYLQNALASTMSQQQQQQQLPDQQDSQDQSNSQLPLPYHPSSAVFKPNYMQDVLLNETCILNSPMNSMDTSACTTTKTTPLMHPISVHEFDQLPLNNNHHLHHYHFPHEHANIAARSDSITTLNEDKKCILPSPLSPMTVTDGKQPHDEYLNFVTTFSIHPQSTSSLVFRNHHHINSAVRHASYDLGCSTSENVIATPESSPNIRKGLFEDNSSRFPIIPSSPTFPAALNLSHGKVVPQKMPKQSGPVLQPAFEIKNMTTIKKINPEQSAATGRSKSYSRKNINTANVLSQGYESMKKRLLARYSTRLLQRMRLSESDTKCRKHCEVDFTNYLELINHYEDNGLQMHLETRNFKCPVKECPMNIIGFDKRADLRHHVHSDHLTHGLVSAQYSKYSDEIKKYLFVCDEPSCGKGFYRSDTLTRHVKLVHKRTSNFTRRRRRRINKNHA